MHKNREVLENGLMTHDARNSARFRFYEELNDFLPPERCKKEFEHRFREHPAVKDALEALGVPHTEVDMILVSGTSVGFNYQLQDGDRVSVYPVFESLDISPLVRLRPEPLRRAAFVLDVHLGKLARLLRMLGFDTLYRNDFDDPELVRISADEHRTLLTRDRRLLFFRAVSRGYWMRNTDPEKQLHEVLDRFDLYAQVEPFRRCIVCNGLLEPVEKAAVLDQLEPLTKRYYRLFRQCAECGKIYWRGTHFHHMNRLLRKIRRWARERRV
jgi:uncharacterized protein with PIN domain